VSGCECYGCEALRERVDERATLRTELTKLRAVAEAARVVASEVHVDRHDRRCAVSKAAVWGQSAVCSCGLQELRTALAALETR
jgi:hypothetical protein